MSKIQFWKQFTTLCWDKEKRSALYSICQRYNFESNLQRGDANGEFLDTVFDMSKIQFWKQFTTPAAIFKATLSLYSICQRYNFESNLQRRRCVWITLCTVFDMSKIQFWKQFTTARFTFTLFLYCIRYVKDTILKAIYNTIY